MPNPTRLIGGTGITPGVDPQTALQQYIQLKARGVPDHEVPDVHMEPWRGSHLTHDGPQQWSTYSGPPGAMRYISPYVEERESAQAKDPLTNFIRRLMGM